MLKFCSRCGGERFHKKGIENGVQQYRCVSVMDDGSICGCRKQPIFVSEEERSELEDIRDEGNKLAKKVIKLQDKQRIENKTFRENTRVENAVVEYVKELKNVIEENKPAFVIPEHRNYGYDSASVGIVHLSDLHFNELVDIVGNTYDFSIASKRLKMFASKIITAFNARKIKKIYLVMTGDMLNSDRRVDELLALATNRSAATFISVKILAQFIIDLAMHFNVNIISITGNESRVRDEQSLLDCMVTDNYDFMIYEMLKLLLSEGEPVINFISGDTFEYVLSVNDRNILIVHGNKLGKMTHTDLSKAISKWAKKNVVIHSIMCGHLHETQITDTLLRSGSLVGNNAYADVGLNLHSQASQNFYIIDERGTIDATKVDLQNVFDDSPMYEIQDDLDGYNAKSVDKLRETTNILRVVI